MQNLFLNVFACTEGSAKYHLPMPLGSYFRMSKGNVQVRWVRLETYLVYDISYCLPLIFILQVGHCVLQKENYRQSHDAGSPPLLPLHCQMPVLESLMHCVQMGWMAILVRVYFNSDH